MVLVPSSPVRKFKRIRKHLEQIVSYRATNFTALTRLQSTVSCKDVETVDEINKQLPTAKQVAPVTHFLTDLEGV